MKAILIATVLLLSTGMVQAAAITPATTGTIINEHSGGTDKYGCHIDHSTGIRHCH